MSIMEKITNATIREDGYAPVFVIWLVRTTMTLIWFTHDIFFAPIFGRGDGNKVQKLGRLRQDRVSLLEKMDEEMGYQRCH